MLEGSPPPPPPGFEEMLCSPIWNLSLWVGYSGWHSDKNLSQTLRHCNDFWQKTQISVRIFRDYLKSTIFDWKLFLEKKKVRIFIWNNLFEGTDLELLEASSVWETWAWTRVHFWEYCSYLLQTGFQNLKLFWATQKATSPIFHFPCLASYSNKEIEGKLE